MSQNNISQISKIPTGIDQLDQALNGGIPENEIILLTGPPGSGKTVTALTMMRNLSRRGFISLYVSSEIDTSHVMEQYKSLRIDDVDIYSLSRILKDPRNLFRKSPRGAVAVCEPYDLYLMARELSESREKRIGIASVETLYHALSQFIRAVGSAFVDLDHNFLNILIAIDTISMFYSKAPSQARFVSSELMRVLKLSRASIIDQLRRMGMNYRDKKITINTLVISQVTTSGATFGYAIEHGAGGIIQFLYLEPYQRIQGLDDDIDRVRRYAYIKKMRYTKHYDSLMSVHIGEEIDGEYRPVFFRMLKK